MTKSIKDKIENFSTEYLQIMCQHRTSLALVILLTAIAFAGCSRRYDDYPVYSPFAIRDYENHGVGRFKSSYLVEQIDQYYRGANPGPIGVATFVDVDDLYNTSTFGRMYSEQVMGELAMKGFDVIELRHADALQFLSNTGEFALSRDIALVRRERDLGGVLVGTYAISPDRVYVNARLLDPSNSMVLGAGSVEMPKTREIARMLRGGSFPATLERIPVQNLGLTTYPLGYWHPGYHAWDEEELGSPGQNLAPRPNVEPRLSAPAPGAH